MRSGSAERRRAEAEKLAKNVADVTESQTRVRGGDAGSASTTIVASAAGCASFVSIPRQHYISTF